MRRRGEGVVCVLLRRRALLDSFGRGEDVGSFVGELGFKVLGSENADFGEHELALDRFRVRVVEDGPDGDLCCNASCE